VEFKSIYIYLSIYPSIHLSIYLYLSCLQIWTDIHRRFIYKGDTSTHAQGTDHRRFIYKGDTSTDAQGTDPRFTRSESGFGSLREATLNISRCLGGSMHFSISIYLSTFIYRISAYMNRYSHKDNDVLLLSCRVLCCSCCVFACVTCFSSYIYTTTPGYRRGSYLYLASISISICLSTFIHRISADMNRNSYIYNEPGLHARIWSLISG